MNEQGPKITIGPDDLPPPETMPAPPPAEPAERLVLIPVPVPAESPVALPVAIPVEPGPEEAAVVEAEPYEPAPPHLLSLVLVSFVPFVNAWYWARLARRLPAAAPLGWAMALFLGFVSLALTIFLASFLRGAVGGPSAGAESGDWLERLADRQGSSVVVVRATGGEGTAFVLASDDDRHLLLTNRHVLAGGPRRLEEVRLGDTCRVQLRNETEQHPATVVGLPGRPDLDLALLEVRVGGLVPLGPVADFAEVRQGERVAAVGHPLGLEFSITEGIVSAKRDGLYIQTTAEIRPGNSGGPLINARGKVLGVCTLLLDPRAGQPVGMALRADFVLRAGDWQLRDDGVGRLMAAIPR